ncbi:MAG: SIMPL domain-containing protein [Chloroflexota bacterium]
MSQRLTIIMNVSAIILLLAALIMIFNILNVQPPTAQAEVGVTGMRQVTVVGKGEVQGQPDTATVQIGVVTEAPTSQEALAQNNEQAQAIRAKMIELGIEERDLQTSSFNIYPSYDSNGEQVTGYTVNNSVMVTIRSLDQAGTLLDQVVQSGANNVYGITFKVDDPEELYSQAREQAMQNAQTRASEFASAGNASVGDVLIITENIGSEPQIPFEFARGADMAMEEAATVPVEPGEQTFTVSVQVTYELR